VLSTGDKKANKEIIMKEMVLITGGSGSIGKFLTDLLINSGYEVIVLSRKTKKQNSSSLQWAHWNPETRSIDIEALQKADYIIHLAGENIGNKRWSYRQKNKILQSRIAGSELLVKTLKENKNSVKAVISASGIGFYGEDLNPKTRFEETDPAGKTFLAKVCQEWEKSVQPIQNELGKRLVIFRTSVVMDPKSGALKEFLKPLKFRLATILGNGTQKLSWIHIQDAVQAYLFALRNEKMEGIYNLCAPQIITYRQTIIKLAKEKYGNSFLPVKIPGFILKTLMGEMAEEMVLKGTSASCHKLLKSEFRFLYPSFGKDCVRNLLNIKKKLPQ